MAALNYIFSYEIESSGAVKQNTWLNGNAVFGSIQMDEVADPIILAYQLGATGSSAWTDVEELANYLVANGPYTLEERWEENAGLLPGHDGRRDRRADLRRVHRRGQQRSQRGRQPTRRPPRRGRPRWTT